MANITGDHDLDDNTQLSHLYHIPSATNNWVGASLHGAIMHPNEGLTVSLRLTEAQRVRAIRVSKIAVSGGDGHGILLEAEPGFVRDISENVNNRLAGLACTETVDSTVPVIQNVELFLTLGKVKIYY